MTKDSREAFRWPPRCRLAFYNVHGVRLRPTTDRDFDLADGLMSRLTKRTIYLGVRTDSAKWVAWDEETISKIEWRIRYDLNFDGYRVVIERAAPLSKPPAPCASEFRWRLRIT